MITLPSRHGNQHHCNNYSTTLHAYTICRTGTRNEQQSFSLLEYSYTHTINAKKIELRV